MGNAVATAWPDLLLRFRGFSELGKKCANCLCHTVCSLPWPAAGCRWAGLRDPVPASLTASRKLSSEGNELLEQKQPEKAEAKLAEAVKTCPTDCDARRYYAEALWLRNARPEAVAQLEEACRLSPDSDLRVRLAEMYLEMGRLEEAGATSTRP